MKVIKINNEISSELKEIIYNTKNNVETNKEKICYLTNSINKLNNKLGVPGNSITPSEKNIELLLGECKKIDYLISSYDLQENIDIIIKDDNIVIRVDKQIIKANNLGNTIIYVKDYNNNLTDIINVSVIENKNNNYSENFICNLEGKNVIRTNGNKVLFQDSSGNENGFINEYDINFSVNKEEGYVLYNSGKVYSPENMIKGSFTLNFIMSQNNQDVGYPAMFNLLNDGSIVLNISQYANQNPYLKIGDDYHYGNIAGVDYWGINEINEYTYVFDYDTHYVIIYKNGVKISEVYSDYLSTDYLSGTTKFMWSGTSHKYYNVRIYDRVLTESEVYNLFLCNKKYNDLNHVERINVENMDLQLNKNIAYKLKYTVEPFNAYNPEVFMVSEDESVIRTYKDYIYTIGKGECNINVYSKDNGVATVIHATVTDNDVDTLDGYATIPLDPNLDFYVYNSNKDTSTYGFETKYGFNGFDFKDYTLKDTEVVKSNYFPTVTDAEKAAYLGECISGASGDGINYFTIKISKDKLIDGSVSSFNDYINTKNININFKLKENTKKYIVNTSTEIEILDTKNVSDMFICAKILCDDLMYVYNVSKDNILCKRFVYAENIDNKSDKPNISYTYESKHNYILLKIPKYFLKSYNAEGVKEYLNVSPLEIYAYTDCNTPTTFNMTTNKNTITIGDLSVIKTEVKDATGEEIPLNEVIYYSSDENIATVNDGIVYGKSKGNVTITGRTAYKNLIQTLDFVVEENKTGEILNNVEYMKTLDLQEGSTYTTNGYYLINDNGQATYDIMSYDNYYNSLPEDCKFMNEVGLSFFKTTVNGYGDHILNNGLVAKVRRGMEVTPEQWGCIGDGVTDNVSQMVAMFALNKTGKITFRQDALYMCYRKLTLNPYMRYMVGRLNGGSSYNRPIIANVKDLYIDGNNATIKNSDDGFDKTGSGILNFAGVLENLTIDNLIIDGNCYTMKTCADTNHGMFYAPAFYWDLPEEGHVYGKDPANDPYVVSYDNGITRGAIKNWTIKNCTIKNTGTMYNDLDCGYGDDLLIINPYNVDGLNIINNKFLNWGRWVLAIDLGGAGEKLYNVKFNNNTCIQQNEVNRVPHKKQRGLGWIDFESKKSFGNLEVIGNYVEGVTGFALNGNGKVSDHIVFKDNTLIKPVREYAHSYLYGLEWYSCYIDDLLLENNYYDGNAGDCKLGVSCSNITIRNNRRLNKTRLPLVRGDITIEDNNFDSSHVFTIEGFADELYNTDRINIIYRNNRCGLESAPSDDRVHWTIENNDVAHFDINSLLSSRRESVDVSQFNRSTTYSIRGFRPINGSPKDRHLIPGGAYFEEGEIIYEDCTNAGMAGLAWYCIPENNGGANLSQYNSVVNRYCAATGMTKMVCTKTGYFPCNGAFAACQADTEISNGVQINSSNTVLYDNDYVYVSKNTGTLGSTITESNGIYTCGDVNMVRVLPLGKFRFE